MNKVINAITNLLINRCILKSNVRETKFAYVESNLMGRYKKVYFVMAEETMVTITGYLNLFFDQNWLLVIGKKN